MPARLPFRPAKRPDTIRLTAIAKADWPKYAKTLSGPHRRYAMQSGFVGEAGGLVALPGRDGRLERVLVGIAGDDARDGSGAWMWGWAGLPLRLPKGLYRLDPEPVSAADATRIATAWGIGSYVFDRYKKVDRAPAELVWPERADRKAVQSYVRADGFARDLINTPTEDMGPDALAAAAVAMADELGMTSSVIVGEDLVRQGYNLIHAVGRAAAREPRLIELGWGDAADPLVTLVGKGVCFDTGGLGIKPDTGMKLMKKDMGGAAHVLALARLVVEAKLKLRLQVLVPAVENSIAGNAVRPLDIIRSKVGKTVEIGHTDAEGRLILADAFARAAQEKPELMVDFATLTGAARVALGPDLPALFSNDTALADALLESGLTHDDPCWRMPLWRPYRSRIDSKIADLNNVSDSPFAGATIAALFMQEFVPASAKWAHFDIVAWSPWARPGRPEGAHMQGLRAAFAVLAKRYAR